MINATKRYTQIACPTSGGFGDVICCMDNHLERKVAIKFIREESEKKRILDELRALLQMRSKHVVQIYDIVHGKDGSLGIVEEFVEGEDLWDNDFPRQSPENYLKTLWQISAGIADIHNAGVIHRDIKPNNMKLDAEGIVKIFDFGLAKNEGDDAKTRGFRGTPGFAAPELFGTSTVAFSSAIDVYAFGATAIFLANKSLPSSMKKLPPEPLKENIFSVLPINLPAKLATLLNKCLTYEPSRRPSMCDVRDEIARHLLRDRHQALAVHNTKPFVINAGNRSAVFDYPSVGKIEISYDGLKFFVSVADGEVYINNNTTHAGDQIPGSCVVALGGAHRGSRRAYITFDVSNPEVVL